MGIYDDIERTLEIARRPSRLVGITPGEDMAMKRVREYLNKHKAPPAPEKTEPLAAAGGDDPGDTEGVDMIDVLGEVGEKLLEAGFENLKQVTEASDDDLLQIQGIGPARVRAIREAISS